MAQGDVEYKSLGITLKGVPPELLPLEKDPQLRAYAEAVKNNAGAGAYNWSEVASIAQQGQQLGDAPSPVGGEEVIGRSNTSVPLELVANTASGTAGRFVRTNGQTAALTATGALIGSIVPGVGTAIGAGAGYVTGALILPAMDMVTEAANVALGTNFSNSQEAWTKLYDKAGIDDAENAVESLLSAAGTGVMDAKSIVNLGKFMQTYGANPKFAPSVTNFMGTIFASNPGREMAGSVAGQLSATGASEAVKESNLPDSLKATIPIVAGAVGGAAGSFIPDIKGPGMLSSLTERQRVRDQSPAVPDLQRKAIDQAKELGTELSTSDVLADPSFNSAGNALATRRRDAGVASKGGTAQRYYDQNAVRSTVVSDAGKKFDVVINDSGRFTQNNKAVAQNFLDVHKKDVQGSMLGQRDVIEELTGQKMPEYEYIIDPGGIEVIDGKTIVHEPVTMSIDDLDAPYVGANREGFATTNNGRPLMVDTEATIAKIQTEIDRLNQISPKRYSNLVKDLGQWQDDIKGKDLSQLYSLRKSIGQAYKNPDLTSVATEAQTFYNKLYNDINEDFIGYIKEHGTNEQYIKYRVNTENLRKLNLKYTDAAIASALRNGELTPTSMTNLLTHPDDEVMKRAVGMLDPDGITAAKTNIMGNMIENSIDGNKYSGNMFSNQIKQYDPILRQIMSPEDMKVLEGNKAFLDSTAFGEAVATGRSTGTQGLNPSKEGAGIGPKISQATRAGMGAPVIVAGAAGNKLKGAWYRHYEKPAVRDMLLRIDNSSSNTTKVEELSKALVRILRAADDAEASSEVDESTLGAERGPNFGIGRPDMDTSREDYTNSVGATMRYNPGVK